MIETKGHLKGRILELEHTNEELRKMFDDILWNDDSRNEYRRIDIQYKKEMEEERNDLR